jgi:septal ring factor EnvC (AmiA/AmiB activator)
MEKSYSIPANEVNYMIEEIRAKYQCEIAELKEQLAVTNDQLHKSEMRNIELRKAIKAMATVL